MRALAEMGVMASTVPSVTDSIECVACASHDVYAVDEWPTNAPQRAIACRVCGLLFLDPQMPQPVPEPRRTLDTGNTSDPPSGTKVQAKKGAAGALIAALDRHLPTSRPNAGARVLDISCGSGAFLNALQDCGWDTYGIEPSTDAAFVRHTRLTAPPPDEGFDLVIAHQMLQRQPRPLDTLRELSRAIRPGGYCLVSVPRLDTLAVHRDIPMCLGTRKSIVAFTEACLRGLLARVGLEVVAALHALDDVWTHGEPIGLRLVARKDDAAASELDPAAALEAVIEALPVATGDPTPAPTPECPACAGRHVQILEQWRLSKRRTRAAACQECGLLFVHPQPSQEVLDAYYAQPDGYKAWKGNRPAGEVTAWTTHDPAVKARRKVGTPVLFTAFDRFFPATTAVESARVLDFGCGPGTWLDRFQDHGWDTYGLEPCTDTAFVRHKRLLTIPPVPQFDLVFLYHVLEHLPRPLDVLRELAQALQPGGYCFISVPRLDTLPVHHEAEYCLHPRHHLVAFTEACLRGLLARAGLEVVASFHDLSSAFNRGLPMKLQVLAHKTSAPPAPEPDPASALIPVVEAFLAIGRQRT